jgi:hypothetical protein
MKSELRIGSEIEKLGTRLPKLVAMVQQEDDLTLKRRYAHMALVDEVSLRVLQWVVNSADDDLAL